VKYIVKRRIVLPYDEHKYCFTFYVAKYSWFYPVL